MAYSTKLKLIDAKMEQPSGSTLTFSGSSIIDITGNGIFRYSQHPDFQSAIYSGDTTLVDKKYVDDIVIDVESDLIYNLESPSVIEVGGLQTGSVLTGKTANEILQDILVPELFGTLTNASASATRTPTTTFYEIGDTIPTLTINASFDRGSIDPQYQSDSPFRSGLPNTYTYSGPDIDTTPKSITSLTDSQSITDYEVTLGSQNWSVSIDFDAGVQPKGSKGTEFDSPLAAGTRSNSTTNIVGAYPNFATTSNITTLTKQTLVNMSTANNVAYTLVTESGGNKQKIQISDTWLNARPLVGIQQFNTVSSQWEYPGGSAAASLLIWTTSSVTQVIQGNTIDYTQYEHNSPDRDSVQVRLVF